MTPHRFAPNCSSRAAGVGAGARFACGLTLTTLLLLAAQAAYCEDGYELWLRYRPVAGEWLERYRQTASELVAGTSSPTLNAAQSELQRGLHGMLGTEVPVTATPSHTGAILFGTAQSSTW